MGRIRNVVLHGVLAILTLGLYFFVWWTQLGMELRKHRGRGAHPIGLLVLFLLVPVLGWFFAVFISAVQVRSVQRHADADQNTSPWYPALWSLVPVVGWAIAAGLLQSGANEAWAQLHRDLHRATTQVTTLECPECTVRFETSLNPLHSIMVTCPNCGKAGEV